MNALGTLVVGRPDDYGRIDAPDAVAVIGLYGPRGGVVGMVVIGAENVREAIAQLQAAEEHHAKATR